MQKKRATEKREKIKRERERQREGYLPKAAFAKHHEEVEIRELHAVAVAIAVEFGDGIRRGSISFLGARPHFGPLESETHTHTHTDTDTDRERV